MKLYSLKIEGFKRIKKAEILFGDATFLIGGNNSGKSSILKAIDYLLSGKKTIPSTEYYSVLDEGTGETKPAVDTIVLEAEIRNIPVEANDWRGFKGRVFPYVADEGVDTGLSIFYKKTYVFGQDVKIELKSKKREKNAEYEDCKTPQDYIDKGVNAELVAELFDELDKNVGTSKSALQTLEEIDEIWDLDDEEVWFQNPGGIPGNVLMRLPRYLLIPANTSINEIQGANSGVLGKTLNELFEVVREASPNYQEAQRYLDELAKELDPEDETSEFGKMLVELNEILSSVFPDSELHATTDLSNPDKSLKPSFDVEMSSNIRTPVDHQGSGMIRAAAFGMLRFRQKWLSDKEDEQNRALVICFEEPEIYLHPSAANQMRDTIYDLSGSDSQIIATTHSPFIIDLSRKPKQLLNRLSIIGNEIKSDAFTVSEAFTSLIEDDKAYIKMLLRSDDHFARIFFTNNVIIIEGDTEEVVIKETLKRLPKKAYLSVISNHEILKARGKATIIGIIKYMTAMGIHPIVVHDRDQGIAGAEVFNQPIQEALNGKGKLILMRENIEDELDYPEPTSEKPFKAYEQTLSWGEEWNDVPESWRNKMIEIFGDYISGVD